MLTRSTIKFLLWTFPLLLATLACRAATNLILPDASAPTPLSTLTFVPFIPDTGSVTSEAGRQASCPSTLANIMTAAKTPAEYQESDQEHHLVTYKVSGEQITDPIFESIPVNLKDKQDDVATQQQIWSYFTALIPRQNRAMVSQYSVLTDGRANVLAAVSQTDNDPSQWVLEVDIADSTDYANLTFTIVHEFGHLLTLNADQVPPSMAMFTNPHDKNVQDYEAAACPNYFSGEGCSIADSYMNHFYQRFWSEIYTEWSQIDQIEDQREYLEQMSQFYARYEDRFVSEYASTNPGEDIAESWAYFALGPKPTGSTIADQKVLFFYEHAELVELREQILSRLCTVFPQ
jgi:hypothetical protein